MDSLLTHSMPGAWPRRRRRSVGVARTLRALPQVLGLLSTLMLRNPAVAAAAAEAGCLEAALGVLAADTAPPSTAPQDLRQWVMRQVPPGAAPAGPAGSRRGAARARGGLAQSSPGGGRRLRSGSGLGT